MPMPMPGCVGQPLAVWHSLGATQEVPGFGVVSSWQTPSRVAAVRAPGQINPVKSLWFSMQG